MGWRLVVYMLLVLGLVTTAQPASVAAHELQQDKGITVVLHTYPDDNPAAGRPTFIGLDFSSVRRGFNVRSCSCTVSTRSSSGQALYGSVVSTNNSSVLAHAVLNFPEPGIYDIAVTGAANTVPSKTFKLVYRVRVAARGDTATSDAAKGRQVVILGATSLVLLAVVAAEAIRRGGRYA